MLKNCHVFIIELYFSHQSGQCGDIKINLSRYYPNIQVSNIQATEMPGLYSASLDNQIIYLDENAQHMLVGSMVRLKTRRT